MSLPRVYVWSQIILLTGASAAKSDYISQAGYSLVIPFQGQCLWKIAGQGDGNVANGANGANFAYILPPATAIEVHNAPGLPWSAFVITFQSIELQKGSEPSADPLAVSSPVTLRVPPFYRLLELAEEIHKSLPEGSYAERYRAHSAFQELMFLLLKAAEESAAAEEDKGVQAVRKTIAYIDKYFASEITHTRLAELSGLSLRHYSRIFRQLTGQSPIDYLIRQRINEAERLLLSSADPIQDIAGKSGFRDPFHFSRSFKRQRGVSPRLYVNLRKDRSRLVTYQYLGEILALGMKPVGAPKLLLASGYLRKQAEGIEEMGMSVVTPYLDKLAKLKPDVILTFDGHHYSQYAKIAPTLDVSWSKPAFERFRLLADHLGKDKEAQAWLLSYQEKVEAARIKLAEYVKPGQTVSFFWARGLPRSFQAYYDAELFYDDLGCMAPEAVRHVQAISGHPFKSDIPVGELGKYAGDHMFVVVSRDPKSQREFRRWRQDPAWNELPAVKNNQVYLLSEDWLSEDPISRLGQLQDVVNLIQTNMQGIH
ncbi:AraC family transcriptional regulator [Paenibacillus eucommiae]|uniref:ABC-type Fe3+-hydroxamate transport system substrate-binding protein n=1 Tax=Paenibacillus eucommiae TaxID=1355755 RepID=A0ABS4IQ35_9BACL|nr:AraC family transcriptional regulator [Paenibacillus eucommiae]MBP1989689.1 ABC-type Fe3+-hydroxamate transport system substrate-binding protein [Paenibacillus eucommiae]